MTWGRQSQSLLKLWWTPLTIKIALYDNVWRNHQTWYKVSLGCTEVKNNHNHSHKKQIVWKHGPNRPFYAVMLRTKLYSNPFFFTGHQNVNKPESRAARTVCGLIFSSFYKTIVRFFLFYIKMQTKQDQTVL